MPRLPRFPRLPRLLQVGAVGLVIAGVIAGDITVVHANVAENHRVAALHRAERAYAAQVDAISRTLYLTVQPVQNALDKLDVTQPTYLAAAMDAVVSTRASVAVNRLAAKVAALKPPATMAAHHTALQKAVKDSARHLASLEGAKKLTDPSDMLDTPYSGYAYSLSDALDAWYDALVKVDAAAAHPTAPAPGAAGTKRPRLTLPASKTSWIFGADHACAVGGHALYLLKDPGSNAALETYAKSEDRYAAILSSVSANLRKVPMPAADRKRLQRGVYRSLAANDQLAAASRDIARALRARDLARLDAADQRLHVAFKALGGLSQQMTAYGATFCGSFFDTHAKPSDKNGGSGTVNA